MRELAITLFKQPESEAGATTPTFDELFDAHHRSVYLAAYRVTGNQHDAEDVLQSVFLRLLQSKQQRDGHTNPSAYLHRSAINAGIDLLRSRNRAPTESFIEEVHGAESGEPGNDLRRAELRRHLRSAMLELEPRVAEVFALRYFEDFSNSEIAAILETTPNTVSVTLHRARARLQDILGELVEAGEGENR